jgi:hypothetical protein
METIALLHNAVSGGFHSFNAREDSANKLETVSTFSLLFLR